MNDAIGTGNADNENTDAAGASAFVQTVQIFYPNAYRSLMEHNQLYEFNLEQIASIEAMINTIESMYNDALLQSYLPEDDNADVRSRFMSGDTSDESEPELQLPAYSVQQSEVIGSDDKDKTAK